MRMLAQVSILPVAALMLISGTAWGKKCSDLPGASQAKCKAKVAQQCSSVTGYWPKRRCEEKVAGSMDSCSSEASVKACQALRKDYEQVCRGLNERYNSRAAKEWLAKIKALPAVLKRLKAYQPVLKDCGRKISGCNFGPPEAQKCQQASRKAQAAWAEHLSYFVKETLKIRWGHLEAYEKGKQFADAAAKTDEMITMIKEQLKLNETPELRGNVRALKAELKKLEQKQTSMKKAAKAAMAKIRCPAKARARGKWVAMIKKHFAKHNPNVKEAIKRFDMKPGKKKTYHGFRKQIVREHKTGVACVHRVKESKEVDCFIIWAKFSRQKNVAEKKWGDWIIDRFHNTEFMLCKNLR